MSRIERGTLRRRIAEVSARALRSGALEPIATRTSFVEESGVRFVVRVLERIERKRASNRRAAASGRNPFLPYEEELFVADVSETHVALLNKFNVMEEHLILVTRKFEEQESPLTEADFEAASIVLSEIDGLVFYNSGEEAGASQRHKHLQLVPFPLGPAGNEAERFPFERFFSRQRWRELPFPCHFVPLEDSAAPALLDRYHESLAAVGRENDPRAYNLLAAREWMLLVPRRRGSAGAIPVNALAFAGAFLVPGEPELEELRRRGPTSVLREAAGESLPGEDRGR